MRQLGIVKWFQWGLNEEQNRNKYDGVVYIIESKTDVYIDKKHVLCEENELRPGVYITLEESNTIGNGEKEAIEVKLLIEEENRDILQYCVNSNNEELWKMTIANYINGQCSNDELKYHFAKINTLNDSDKKSILERINYDIKFREDIFCMLDYKTQIEITFKAEGKIIKYLWKLMNKECKILFLYKASKCNLKPSIIEKLSENDKLIRSMLLILWAKNNQPNKEIIFRKSFELFQDYTANLDYNKEREVLNLILPKEEKRAISMSNQWYEWSLFQFIEESNKTPLIDELEDESKYVSKLTLLVDELIRKKEWNIREVS